MTDEQSSDIVIAMERIVNPGDDDHNVYVVFTISQDISAADPIPIRCVSNVPPAVVNSILSCYIDGNFDDIQRVEIEDDGREI